MNYYKCLVANRMPAHGGAGQWPPPGEWLTAPGPLVLCEPGTLHLCRRQDVILWLSEELWEAEADGEVLVGEDKIGCLRARLVRRVDTWTERAARLFATDCAERALRREREAGREPDARSWRAVAVARAFVRGEATDVELAAARDAARDAARAATWAAAGAATWAAAGAAARDAARAATRDAAGAAAGAATWAAARAAARDAARDAARAAARAAARDAERAWQTERLWALLEGR